MFTSANTKNATIKVEGGVENMQKSDFQNTGMCLDTCTVD